jgi:hypothetical protein
MDTMPTKIYPVEGFAMLMVGFLFLYFFDKWIIKKDKPHHSLAFHDKNASLIKRAWHSFLWMVEIFCGLYLIRGVRTNGEPFRRATTTEKRLGGCFMIVIPLLMLLIMTNTKSFDSIVDALMYGRCSMLWFYIGYIAVISGGVLLGIFIAPRIPLFVSVPLAVMSWGALAWLLVARHLV